jgi:hypothetical protein
MVTGGCRSVLVLSTTPPLPRDYGNRNRVHQTVSLFRRMGFSVSFLLYPIDRDWAEEVPGNYRQLVESFEYFAVVPNSRRLHQNARGYHHAIDEWWDDTVAQQLIWLFQRKSDQDTLSRRVMRTGLGWGCPFVLYWEMCNNEVRDGRQRGFWLIDDMGRKQPVYLTLQQYYRNAPGLGDRFPPVAAAASEFDGVRRSGRAVAAIMMAPAREQRRRFATHCLERPGSRLSDAVLLSISAPETTQAA